MSVKSLESGRRFLLPPSRGPWSERLFAALLGASDPEELEAEGLPAPRDPLADHDFQLALYVAYELHYAAIGGVDDHWEWAPSLIAFRGAAEAIVDSAITAATPTVGETGTDVVDVGEALQQMLAVDDGPPLSRFLEREATRQQAVEHVIHRSAYQLKEADPHSWAIPRLSGAAKAALLEIQFDEYGCGVADRMHSALFARTMEGLGLNPSYGAYVGRLPGITLATVNLLTGFGLRRSRRGALVGHLAMFEMTSSIPNRRYGNAFRRLGYDAEVTAFYDEHVQADAVHENIAAWDLAGGLAQQEPETAPDILFGAQALLAIEARWAMHLLDAWAKNESSLLPPFPGEQRQ